MGGRFTHYTHVFRMAGLFVIGITSFFILRAVFVPNDFGVYGHYRAGALADIRARVPKYAGVAACAACHPDIVEARNGSRHERIGCEACHGASARHAAGEDNAPKPVKPDTRTGCLMCHVKDASRPIWLPLIVPAEHAPEGACTACHNAHKPGLSGGA